MGGDVVERREWRFQDQGRGRIFVLLVSYRGYGGNRGSPTEEGLYADARATVMKLVMDRNTYVQYCWYSVGAPWRAPANDP